MRRDRPQSGHGRAAGPKGTMCVTLVGGGRKDRDPGPGPTPSDHPRKRVAILPSEKLGILERGFWRSVHTLEAVLTGEGQERRPALRRAEAFGAPSAQSSGRSLPAPGAHARYPRPAPRAWRASGPPRRPLTIRSPRSKMLRTLPWLVEVGTISIMRIGSRRVGGMVRREGTIAERRLNAYAASAVSLPAASSASPCRPSGSGRRGGIPNHVMRGWSRAVTILRGITCYISARWLPSGIAWGPPRRFIEAGKGGVTCSPMRSRSRVAMAFS